MATIEEQVTVDPWDVKEFKSIGKPWGTMTHKERFIFVLAGLLKAVISLTLLYLFIISLSFLTAAFRLLGGKTAGKALSDNELLSNPVAGLVLGVLATVLLQSSSASTSIVVSMTAADLITVKNAIPLIMGANIGTSVTNTIVSVAQIGDSDEYRRAFAGATVHDCFNLLTVAILFPIEVISGMLRHISKSIVDGMDLEEQEDEDFLKLITKPVTDRVIQVDTKVVTSIAKGENEDDTSLIKQGAKRDNHLFLDTPLSDSEAGWLLLVTSLTFLLSVLVCFVHVLQSIFAGKGTEWVRKLVNLEFRAVPFLADYVLLLVGIGLTILMQSSSITTSTLTPLVGIGLIRLDKMLPFTVGANIGTTLTGFMAAFGSSNLYLGLQVALAHLFFNLFGTAIWFPLPFMRQVPLGMAKVLGNLAAEFRWFPFAYIAIVFAVVPAILLALSLAGTAFIAVFGTIIVLLLLAVIIILALRLNRPQALPGALQRDPDWMPQTFRVNPTEQGDGNNELGEEKNANRKADTAKWNNSIIPWALGWWALILLYVSIPNAQWANIKYKLFDGRPPVGIGYAEACSEMYTEQTNWATQLPLCTEMQLAQCATPSLASCGESGYADKDGKNADYEDSWKNCSSRCPTVQWEAFCHRMECTGSLHSEQCQNVSRAVLKPYVVTYGPETGVAWKAGERCQNLDTLCDNDGAMKSIGNLAIAGTFFLSLGWVLQLIYGMFSQRFAHYSIVHKLLPGSFATLFLGSLLVLISWATFADKLGGDVNCVVMDESSNGVVHASGQFKDIINGHGSYTFGFVIAAWILTLPTIYLVGERVYADLERFGMVSGQKAATEEPEEI